MKIYSLDFFFYNFHNISRVLLVTLFHRFDFDLDHFHTSNFLLVTTRLDLDCFQTSSLLLVATRLDLDHFHKSNWLLDVNRLDLDHFHTSNFLLAATRFELHHFHKSNLLLGRCYSLGPFPYEQFVVRSYSLGLGLLIQVLATRSSTNLLNRKESFYIIL